mgnify:CR=1 FL=1
MGKNKTNGLPRSIYERIYLPYNPHQDTKWDISESNFFERMKKEDGGTDGKKKSGQPKQNKTKS